MKFAIVDLGSNTIRLSVYNTLPEGGFDLLFSEKEMAGLVSYVHGGVLSPEGIQRACGAIRDFQALLRQFDLDAPHVFATASLRNIRNTEEAVEQIRAATRRGGGCDLRRAGGQTGLLRRPDGHGLAGRRHVRHWRRQRRGPGGPGPGRSKRPRACPSDPWSCSIAAWTACGPRKRSWSGSAAPWPRP